MRQASRRIPRQPKDKTNREPQSETRVWDFQDERDLAHEGFHRSVVQGNESNISPWRVAERPMHCWENSNESVTKVCIQDILSGKVLKLECDHSFIVDQCLLSYRVEQAYPKWRVYGKCLLLKA